MRRFPIVFLVVAAALAAQEAAPRPLAIKVKRALTVSGAAIDDAVIVIEGGKITAIGPASSTDVPEEADVIEGDDLVATPGFVHPASLAMGTSTGYDVSGRNNAADKLVADEIVPTWPGVKVLVEAGFTRVNVIAANGGFAGQSVLVKPLKKLDRPVRPDDVIATRDLALTMAFEPRTTNKTFWKETLAKAKKQRDERAGAKGKAESGPASRAAGADSKPADDAKPASRVSEAVQDPKVTPIVEFLDGRMPGILTVANASALLHFQPLVAEIPEFKPSLMILDEAWRLVDTVKKMGVAVILQPSRELRPDTDVEIVPVRDFVDAGIAVALVPESSFSARYEAFLFHLAELARKGVSREALLRAITLTPAEMLGIQKEVGSLDKGKAGDVLVWSAHPLSPEARLLRVVVGGATVYDAKEKP